MFLPALLSPLPPPQFAAWRPNLGPEELSPLLMDLPYLHHLREFRLLLAPAAVPAPPQPPSSHAQHGSLLTRLRSGSPAAGQRPAVPLPSPSRVPVTASGHQIAQAAAPAGAPERPLGSQQLLDTWWHHGGPLTTTCSRCGCAVHSVGGGGGGAARWGHSAAGAAGVPPGSEGLARAVTSAQGRHDGAAVQPMGVETGGSPQALPAQHAAPAADASPFHAVAAAAAAAAAAASAPPPGMGGGGGVLVAGAEAPSPPRQTATAAHHQPHAALHPQPWPERMLQRVLHGIQDMPYMSAVLSRMRLAQAPRAVAGDGSAVAVPPGDWAWEEEAGGGGAGGGGSALLPSQGTEAGTRAAGHSGVGYLSADALVLLLCALGSAAGGAGGGGGGCGDGMVGLQVMRYGSRSGCCTCNCHQLAECPATGGTGPSAAAAAAADGGCASASGYQAAARRDALRAAAGRPGAVCDSTSTSSSHHRSCMLPACVLEAARSTYNSPAKGEVGMDGGGTPQHGAAGHAASADATGRSHGGAGGGGAGAGSRTPDVPGGPVPIDGSGGCPCSGDMGVPNLEGRAKGQGTGASGCRRQVQEQLWEWEDKWSRSRPAAGDGTLCGAAGMDFLWGKEEGSVSGDSTSSQRPAQPRTFQPSDTGPQQAQSQRAAHYTAAGPSTTMLTVSHDVTPHVSCVSGSPFVAGYSVPSTPGVSSAAASPTAAPWSLTNGSSSTCSRPSSTKSSFTTSSSSSSSLGTKGCSRAARGTCHMCVLCPVNLVLESMALLPPPAALAHSLLAHKAASLALQVPSRQQHTPRQATLTTTAAQPQQQLQLPGGVATPLQLLSALVAAASCAWDEHHEAMHMVRQLSHVATAFEVYLLVPHGAAHQDQTVKPACV